tara:strand:- start:282 stop:1403 length:1122 start_codon:yes stop_codon:yes gene_type:complete
VAPNQQLVIVTLAALVSLMSAGCEEASSLTPDLGPKPETDAASAIQSEFDALVASHHDTTESSLGLSGQIRETPNSVQWAFDNRFGEPFDIGWNQTARKRMPNPVRIALIDESFDVEAPGLKHAFDVDSGINLLEPNKPFWFAHRNGSHHGNLVASIIANRPVTKIDPLGVLAGHDVELIPIVAAGGHGPAWRTPRSSPEMILAGLRHAIGVQADIINISAGIDVSQEQLETLAADPIWTRLEEAGIQIVCAAGNDGRNIDESPIFPASIPNDNVIAVMGMGPTGQPSRRPLESGEWILGTNFGPQTVTVAGPGELVEVQARPDQPELANGTSIAAAFVTAALAMDPRMHVMPVPGLETQCRSRGLIQLPEQP